MSAEPQGEAAAQVAAVAERLAEAFDRERADILAGRYAGLAEAAPGRRAALEALAAAPPEALRSAALALRRMRAAASRNAELLRSALDGAAAGRRRAEEIDAARTALSGYDAQGAPVKRSMAPGPRGRRA